MRKHRGAGRLRAGPEPLAPFPLAVAQEAMWVAGAAVHAHLRRTEARRDFDHDFVALARIEIEIDARRLPAEPGGRRREAEARGLLGAVRGPDRLQAPTRAPGLPQGAFPPHLHV